MREVVCVHVVDSKEGQDSAAGFTGLFGGNVRPMMTWESEFRSLAKKSKA